MRALESVLGLVVVYGMVGITIGIVIAGCTSTPPKTDPSPLPTSSAPAPARRPVESSSADGAVALPSPLSSDTASTAAGSACNITPIRTDPWPGSIRGLKGIPWVQLDPPSAGVTAHLFYGNRPMHTAGAFPNGPATKVLWIVDNPGGRDTLSIEGRNLTGTGTFQQHLGQTSASSKDDPSISSSSLSSSDQFPSIVTVPSPGCWRLVIRSGSVTARMVLCVVD